MEIEQKIDLFLVETCQQMENTLKKKQGQLYHSQFSKNPVQPIFKFVHILKEKEPVLGEKEEAEQLVLILSDQLHTFDEM